MLRVAPPAPRAEAILATGRVEFRIIAHSRRAPIRNAVLRLGFRVFGRRTQLRFYRHALARLLRLLADPPAPPQPGSDGIDRMPSGLEPDRLEALTLRFPHPGCYPTSGVPPHDLLTGSAPNAASAAIATGTPPDA